MQSTRKRLKREIHMNCKNKKSRLLSALLAIAMIVTLMPVTSKKISSWKFEELPYRSWDRAC